MKAGYEVVIFDMCNSALSFYVAEYQCLRREVRSLRAESHSLAEKIAQQSCNATGNTTSAAVGADHS